MVCSVAVAAKYVLRFATLPSHRHAMEMELGDINDKKFLRINPKHGANDNF